MLKKAVIRRSGGLPCPGLAGKPSLKSEREVITSTALQSRRVPHAETPALESPAPTTPIVNDTYCRWFHHQGWAESSQKNPVLSWSNCEWPDWKNPQPLGKPSHCSQACDSCWYSRQQSELLKRDFTHLFNLLKGHPGKSFFISGPIPTLGHGMGRFSRLLSQHTWLHSHCSTHRLLYINNFNLFREPPPPCPPQSILLHFHRVFVILMIMDISVQVNYILVWMLLSDQILHIKTQTLVQTSSKLNMALFNIRALSNKSFYINELISDNDLDCLFLTETWLGMHAPATLTEACPANYVFSLSCREGRKGSGTATIHIQKHEGQRHWPWTVFFIWIQHSCYV